MKTREEFMKQLHDDILVKSVLTKLDDGERRMVQSYAEGFMGSMLDALLPVLNAIRNDPTLLDEGNGAK